MLIEVGRALVTLYIFIAKNLEVWKMEKRSLFELLKVLIFEECKLNFNKEKNYCFTNVTINLVYQEQCSLAMMLLINY